MRERRAIRRCDDAVAAGTDRRDAADAGSRLGDPKDRHEIARFAVDGGLPVHPFRSGVLLALRVDDGRCTVEPGSLGTAETVVVG
jgi:hypothetical protein